MKKDMLIKMTAAIVLLIYMLTSMGINVHSCKCSGAVSISIAAKLGEDHCCPHGISHDKLCSNCGQSTIDPGHEHCCSDQLFKISLTGSDDTAWHVRIQSESMDLPPRMPRPCCCNYCCEHNHDIAPRGSPMPGDILSQLCIIRI